MWWVLGADTFLSCFTSNHRRSDLRHWDPLQFGYLWGARSVQSPSRVSKEMTGFLMNRMRIILKWEEPSTGRLASRPRRSSKGPESYGRTIALIPSLHRHNRRSSARVARERARAQLPRSTYSKLQHLSTRRHSVHIIAGCHCSINSQPF